MYFIQIYSLPYRDHIACVRSFCFNVSLHLYFYTKQVTKVAGNLNATWNLAS